MTIRAWTRLVTRRILHLGVSCFQAVRRVGWFITRPETVGVHGIPLTPEGKVVLVTLSYAHGWRLPGGGKNEAEDFSAAMLRELREEIGLVSHESLELVSSFEHRLDFRRGKGSLFVIRGVRYRPKWSLEVKEVGEFDLGNLPENTAKITLQLIALAAPRLGDG